MSVSIAEGNRRLLVLAEFLEKLEPEKFKYLEWARAAELSCPSTACALGWCPSIPEFAGELELFQEPEGGDIGVRFRGSGAGDAYDESILTAEHFFALSELEAEFIFVPSMMLGNEQSPTGRASAAVVAAHIRRFVESRK